MNDQHLIGKMRVLRSHMIDVAEALDERGNEGEAGQMILTANIMLQWIEAIKKDMLSKQGGTVQ